MTIDARVLTNSFVCPYPDCKTKSHQYWYKCVSIQLDESNFETLRDGCEMEHYNGRVPVNPNEISSPRGRFVNPILFSSCMTCQKISVWMFGKLTFPAPMEFSPPTDLPEECLPDFTEACAVAPHSARAGAALMRSCLENLLKKVTGKDNPSDAIKKLVAEKQCDKTIQEAMDYVRVVGNKALHNANEIPMLADDTGYHFETLVSLIGYIVDDQITRPKKIKNVYSTLPETERTRIDRRDNKDPN